MNPTSSFSAMIFSRLGARCATGLTCPVLAAALFASGCGGVPEEQTGQAESAMLPADPGWTTGLAPDAIVGGTDNDGAPLYVCRANYAGIQPGKTRANWAGCDIGSGAREVLVGDYQTLTPEWVAASGGDVPANAISTGHETPPAGVFYTGDPLYTCRATWMGAVHTGKVRPGFDGCYIPYGGREIHVPSYEVLVQTLPLTVASVANAPPPANALVGAKEADGSLVYPCAAYYQGSLIPGKTVKTWSSCDVSWSGGEYWISSYYVLVPQFNTAPLNRATQPYVAGSDTNASPLGICNAHYQSGVQLGEYRGSGSGSCNFGYGGQDISLTSGFQVMSVYEPVIN